MSHISMWFVCKVCSGYFLTVSDFLEHKKEKHFAEFQKTKCIVFEEQPLDQEQEQNSDSNNAEVDYDFLDLKCDLFTHCTSPTYTNTEISTNNSDSVNYLDLDGIKLEVEVDHHPQPQCEPFVLLKRLTKNQLETAQKLNQSIMSNAQIFEGSSPNNEIATIKPRCRHRNFPKSKYLTPAIRPVCDICSKSFTNKYVLNIHLARAHSTGRIFACRCGKTYKCFEDLMNHKIRQKLRKKNGLEYRIKCLQDFVKRKKNRGAVCKLEPAKKMRKLVEPSESDLNLEAQISKNVNVDNLNDPNKCVSKNKPKITILTPVVRPVCQTCSKSFKNKYVLNTHLARAHSTGREFSCKCGKAFKCFENLRNHKICQKMRKEKGLEYRIKCLQDFVKRKKNRGASCKLEPANKMRKLVEPSKPDLNLEAQISNNVNVDNLSDPNTCVSKNKPKITILTPVVRPVCQTCSKSFKNKYVLNTHLARAHSTGREFSCKCGKAFKCFENLRNHKICQKSRKNKGLTYSVKCLEDYAERKKKNEKHYNSPSLERSAEDLSATLSTIECLSEPIENISNGIPPSQLVSNLETDKLIINTVNVDALNDPNTCVRQNKPKRKCLTPAVRPVCQTCSKSFKNNYVLNKHLARAHSTERKFSCKCGKAFKCVDDLRSHTLNQKLRKAKSLKYCMQCLEDYAER